MTVSAKRSEGAELPAKTTHLRVESKRRAPSLGRDNLADAVLLGLDSNLLDVLHGVRKLLNRRVVDGRLWDPKDSSRPALGTRGGVGEARRMGADGGKVQGRRFGQLGGSPGAVGPRSRRRVRVGHCCRGGGGGGSIRLFGFRESRRRRFLYARIKRSQSVGFTRPSSRSTQRRGSVAPLDGRRLNHARDGRESYRDVVLELALVIAEDEVHGRLECLDGRHILAGRHERWLRRSLLERNLERRRQETKTTLAGVLTQSKKV